MLSCVLLRLAASTSFVVLAQRAVAGAAATKPRVGRKRRTSPPRGATTALGYTDAANPTAPTTGTDEQGNQYSFTYDAKGNPLTQKSVTANITDVTRTYNPNGTVE